MFILKCGKILKKQDFLIIKREKTQHACRIFKYIDKVF